MAGWVQLRVIDALSRADNWTASELADWVFDCEPKPYQLSNIVRTLRRLEESGDVAVSPHRMKGRRCWSLANQRPRQEVIRRPRLALAAQPD